MAGRDGVYVIPGDRDPVLGDERLQDAFLVRFPDYRRGITVPAVVDIPTRQVVTNSFPQTTLDLSAEWIGHHRAGVPDLYPEPLRAEIDEVNQRVFTEVNNGVYRCGFARDQTAYEKAFDRLLRRARLAVRAAHAAALPRRRHHHGGRCPALHDACGASPSTRSRASRQGWSGRSSSRRPRPTA
jgi:hypothetical protein